MVLILTMLASLSSQAADLNCANQEARKIAIQALYKHTGQKFTEEEVFHKSVVVDGKVQKGFLLYNTSGEISRAVVSSEVAKKIHLGDMLFTARYNWYLPYGTHAQTLLTDIFCKDANAQ